MTYAPVATPDPLPSRRDILYLATAAMGAAGAAAVAWPFIAQMNPDAATLAASGPVDIDISQMQEGQRLMALWAGRPIFIVRRPKAALEMLQNPKLLNQLRDPDSTSRQQAAYAQNWSRSINPEFGVLVGICTHLGCVPLYEPKPDPVSPAPNWLGGFFCPCHGSKYDLAGRVLVGVPAPLNLPVPPYHYPNEKTLRVGQNPPGDSFDFNSIEQV